MRSNPASPRPARARCQVHLHKPISHPDHHVLRQDCRSEHPLNLPPSPISSDSAYRRIRLGRRESKRPRRNTRGPRCALPPTAATRRPPRLITTTSCERSGARAAPSHPRRARQEGREQYCRRRGGSAQTRARQGLRGRVRRPGGSRGPLCDHARGALSFSRRRTNPLAVQCTLPVCFMYHRPPHLPTLSLR